MVGVRKGGTQSMLQREVQDEGFSKVNTIMTILPELARRYRIGVGNVHRSVGNTIEIETVVDSAVPLGL